jgi:hypothetical protein
MLWKENIMPASEVYQGVYRLLQGCLGEEIDESSRARLALLVTGIIGAKNASPARIASALHKMVLRDAKPESMERHIRRIENDSEISAAICFHPFARWRLLYGKPRRVFLIIDPTSQEDRIVMVSVAIWYRGRALPLAWTTWEANTPLTGKRFWERIEEFGEIVNSAGYASPIRTPRGRDILAACGQLKSASLRRRGERVRDIEAKAGV